MDLTRRSLLSSGAAATAAALIGLRPWAATPAAAAAGAAGHLLRSSYEGLTGTSFAAGSVDLRLLSVSDLAGAAADRSLAGSEDAFALAFAGPLDAALEAGTHTLSHPELGTFELFVSPVDRPRKDRRYEAVVDRSVGVPKSPPKRAERAAATATVAAPAAAHKGARLLRRVTLRRTARGARARIVLLPGASAVRVHGVLMRNGQAIAAAAHEVSDRQAVLRFRDVPGLRPGSYTLQLTVVDDAGQMATRRRRVKLA
jgi:hypothetical protein